jgi:hypothetical protein
MGPILELIREAPFVLIAVRACNDPSRAETQPGAVAFALPGSAQVYVIFPRSVRTLGVCEQMTLFNGLFQNKICTINSRSAKMTLKRLGSVTVPDPVDVKQMVLATTHLILTEWLQKNMGGGGGPALLRDDQ